MVLSTKTVLTQSNAPAYYRLIVSNAFGLLETGALPLDSPYQMPPALLQPSQVYPGDDVTVTAAEQRYLSPATFWWLQGTNVIPNNSGSLPPNIVLSHVLDPLDLDVRLVRSNALALQTSAPLATVLVTQPPEILSLTDEALFDPGSAGSVVAQVRGGPETVSEWWREGVRVRPALPPTRGTATLDFDRVTSAEQGFYTLVLRDPIGSVTSAPVHVLITHSPIILLHPVSQVVTSGVTLTLSASVDAAPAARIDWYRKSTPTDAFPKRVGGGGTLSLPSLAPSDDGWYYFEPSNTKGFVRSESARIEVRYAPFFKIQPPLRTSTNTGLALLIPTEVPANPPASVQWFKAGVPVGGQTNSFLSFPDPQPTDSGTYWAIATNQLGTNRSQSVVVTITDLRPKIVSNPLSLTVSEGADTALSCTVTALPPAVVQWFFQSAPLPAATSAALTLSSLAPSQSGSYFLVASNRAGTATSSIALLTVKPASTHPGALDPGFRVDVNTNGLIQALATLGPDEILVGGFFNRLGGVRVTNLAVLHRDGTISPTRFSPTPDVVRDLAVRPDGRILVNDGLLRCYLPGGETDPSFKMSAGYRVTGRMALMSDGRIVCGLFNFTSGVTSRRKLLSDGSLDPNTAAMPEASSFDLLMEDRGRMLWSTGTGLTRYSADGGLDSAWSTAYQAAGGPSSVRALGILENHSVLAASGGALYSFRPDASVRFRWLNYFVGFNSGPSGALELQDGRVLLFGAFSVSSCCPSQTGFGLNLLETSTGQVSDFALNSVRSARSQGSVNAAAVFGDGSILIGGPFDAINDLPRLGLALLRAGDWVPPQLEVPATPDISLHFGDPLQLESTVVAGYPLAFQWLRDGEQLAGATRRTYAVNAVRGTDAGTYSLVASNAMGVVTGFQATVTVDRPSLTWTNPVSLGHQGINLDGRVRGFLGLPGGAQLIHGSFLSINGRSSTGVARLTEDGRPDEAFTSGLESLRPRDGGLDIWGALSLSDGSVLVAGAVSLPTGAVTPLLRHLGQDGSLIAGFADAESLLPRSSVIVSMIWEQPGRTALLAVSRGISASTHRISVSDPSAGVVPDTVGTGSILPVRLRASQRGGFFVAGREAGQGILMRVDAAGDITPLLQHAQSTGLDVFPGSVVQGGSSGPGPAASDVLELADGSILVSGAFIPPDGVGRNLAVLRANGTTDPVRQNAIRTTGPVWLMQRLSTGEILITGRFSTVGGLPRLGVALLSPNASQVLDESQGKGPAAAAFPHVYCAAENADGQIWLGGTFGEFNGRVAGNVTLLMGSLRLPLPRIDPQPAAIRFWGWEGYHYTLERSSALPRGAWKPLTGLDGVDGPLEVPVNDEGFLRLKAE